MVKHEGSRFWDNLECVLLVLVSLCIIFLNYKGKAIGREFVKNAQEALFLEDDSGKYNDKALEEVLVENLNTVTKRIELYDDQLEPMFQITFNSEPGDPSVYQFARLKEIIDEDRQFKNSGQAVVTIDGMIQSAYYKWLRNSENEQRLVIIYSALGRFQNYYYIDFIAWAGVVITWIIAIKERLDRKKIIVEQAEILERARDVINTL